MEKVTYRQFGAVGDGKADDMAAICAAHAYANEHCLPVEAEPNSIYYIGGKDMTAVVKTNTDWKNAQFIIDDRDVENRSQVLFSVPAVYEEQDVSIKSVERGQKTMALDLGYDAIVSIKDETRFNYIRMGVNASKGTALRDTFLLTKEGNILNRIMWEYPSLTSAKAKRIEEEPLTIKGGFFVTLANQMPSFYTYFSRNIAVTRSRVTLAGITHRIEGEGERGAPYAGFITAHGCAYFQMENCSLTGHKIYYTQGQGGMTPMGTYDISLGSTLFATLRGITQVPSIMDKSRWGLMGSNFCKNIILENCEMSRFDAHMGVTDTIVKGCKLGWQCVHAIGEGNFLVEDTEVFGHSVVNLRYDYGGHWDGKLTIRNCVLYPAGEEPSVLWGHNPGTHDFGYICKMPETLEIDGLRIADGDKPLRSIAFLGDYCDTSHEGKPYPYKPTKTLRYRGVTVDSGKDILICRNAALYPNLDVICED